MKVKALSAELKESRKRTRMDTEGKPQASDPLSNDTPDETSPPPEKKVSPDPKTPTKKSSSARGPEVISLTASSEDKPPSPTKTPSPPTPPLRRSWIMDQCFAPSRMVAWYQVQAAGPLCDVHMSFRRKSTPSQSGPSNYTARAIPSHDSRRVGPDLSRKKEELTTTVFCQIVRGHFEVLSQSPKEMKDDSACQPCDG